MACLEHAMLNINARCAVMVSQLCDFGLGKILEAWQPVAHTAPPHGAVSVASSGPSSEQGSVVSSGPSSERGDGASDPCSPMSTKAVSEMEAERHVPPMLLKSAVGSRW